MAMSWTKPTQPVQAKVAILVPHRDEYDYRQWGRWFEKVLEKPAGAFWMEERGVSLTTLRTDLVKRALQTDATHVFLLDDDVVAPKDVIAQLLAPNIPIICGLYMAKKKKEERGLAAWMKVQNGYASIASKQAARYVQADVTGLGCALIHRSIFERVREPWFAWEKPEGPSEDFYFFEKVASELEIKPIIDMEVKCLHIGVFSVDVNGEFDTLDA